MNQILKYKKYRVLGSEYLSRTTVWRINKKRRQEQEEEKVIYKKN